MVVPKCRRIGFSAGKRRSCTDRCLGRRPRLAYCPYPPGAKPSTASPPLRARSECAHPLFGWSRQPAVAVISSSKFCPYEMVGIISEFCMAVLPFSLMPVTWHAQCNSCFCHRPGSHSSVFCSSLEPSDLATGGLKLMALQVSAAIVNRSFPSLTPRSPFQLSLLRGRKGRTPMPSDDHPPPPGPPDVQPKRSHSNFPAGDEIARLHGPPRDSRHSERAFLDTEPAVCSRLPASHAAQSLASSDEAPTHEVQPVPHTFSPDSYVVSKAEQQLQPALPSDLIQDVV